MLLLDAEVGLAGELAAYALAVLDDVVDAQLEGGQLERLGDVGIGTGLEAGGLVFFAGLGGEHDNGQLAVVGRLFDGACELYAVDEGHHDVGDDDVEVAVVDDVEGLLSVAGGIDGVAVGEVVAHEGEQFAVVLDDEHGVVFGFVVIGGVGVAVVGQDTDGCGFIGKGGVGNGTGGVGSTVDFAVGIAVAAKGQADGEGGALLFAALAVDGAVMEAHEVVGERESDASAERVHAAVVPVEETGVEMAHLVGRDADALVGNSEDGIAVGGGEGDVDAASLSVVLDGIG